MHRRDSISESEEMLKKLMSLPEMGRVLTIIYCQWSMWARSHLRKRPDFKRQ